jgi:hypothetical protein
MTSLPKRFRSFEERQEAIMREADEVSRDPGQLKVLREWEGTPLPTDDQSDEILPK